MPKRLFLLLYFLQAILCPNAIGQNELVTQAEVEEIKKDKEYWYADLPVIVEPETPSEKKSISIPAFVGTLLNYIMWALVAIAIVLVLYYLSQNLDFNWNQKTETTAVSQSLEIGSERELRELNYSQLVDEAVNKKDYRTAVRWYYLWILKELSARDKIVYDKFKTNNEYKQKLKEVLGGNHTYLPIFGTAVKYYEYVWFGNFPLSEDQFGALEVEFKSAINKI
ncbi:hypothetical protein SAMN06298216_1623 [Spirosomataceae bacterium TFI 002]|nr:hypothetical protein SAMN06298216_1623 [Spirosomataceae bacterium TFI 002]